MDSDDNPVPRNALIVYNAGKTVQQNVTTERYTFLAIGKSFSFADILFMFYFNNESDSYFL